MPNYTGANITGTCLKKPGIYSRQKEDVYFLEESKKKVIKKNGCYSLIDWKKKKK